MRLGLYIHIPFCSFLCHYCDFAKTANFDAILVQDYFAAILKQWHTIVDHLERTSGRRVSLSSVYFGGGTPSLFTTEYTNLLRAVYDRLDPDAEISMECNPKNINQSALNVWKGLGVNRLSIGVQTLQKKGLAVLTRDHDASTALRGLELAMHTIANVNMDLIYGWPGQNQNGGQADAHAPDLWASDLQQLINSGVPHASLYSLTYEDRTPFGRMARRGKIYPETDEALAGHYGLAREMLGNAGFEHDEVSNWARPGFTCRHNWLYWDFKNFIGIGAGSHGFLPVSVTSPDRDHGELDSGAEIDQGIRYAFPRDVRSFLRHSPQSVHQGSTTALIRELGGEIDEGRDSDSALIEYVGGALRTRHGIDLSFCEKITGQAFSPRPLIVEALKRQIAWRDGPRLHFAPAEWFRENSWASEVLLSF